MKKIIVLVGCVVSMLTGYTQCITGNCDNGIGSLQWDDGIYTGEILANTPHGKGKWSAYYQRGLQVDSIVQEGLYFAGIFFKGTQKTIATWYTANNGGDRTASSIFLNGKVFYKAVYPDTRDIASDYAKEKKWTGKTDKKGMPVGDGDLLIADVKLTINVKDGRITAIKNLQHTASNMFNYNYTLTGVNLTQMNFINELTYTVERNRKKLQDVTFSIVMPLSLACAKLPKQGPAIVTYTNGSRYQGFYTAHEANGFGVFQKPEYGYTDSGLFRFGMLHGWGQRKYNADNSIDTGCFINNNFVYGASSKDGGKTWQQYPQCLSGDCINGTGKVNYSRNSNTFTYEGQLLNGHPNGTGSWRYRSGNNYYYKTGSFVMGELHGYAEIETNITPVKSMRGYFRHDSLTHGTIHYRNSNAQFRSLGLTPGSIGFDSEMQPLVLERITTPRVFGRGILVTATGAVVQGDFNAFNTLMDGTYTGADGYQLRFGDRNRDMLLAAGMGGMDELNMNFDNLDFVVSTYRKRRSEQQAQAEARKATLQAEAKQQQRMDSLMRINSNWQVTTRKETCQLCNGRGTMGNPTLGGDIDYISNVYDRWGNLVSSRFATIEGVGPKRNRRITCTQCFGKGVVNLQDRKYIGPAK